MIIKNFISRNWPILLILIVGSILRLVGLLQNPISLYSDEVDIGYQVSSLIKTGCDYSGNCLPIQFHSFSDVRTPVPIYSTALIHMLGVPLDYSIRLNSVIFGVLGILATYLVLNSLASEKIFNLKNIKPGIYGAAVLALIPWHFTYSRIGFELTTLYFFVVFGFYLFSKYINSNQPKYLYLSMFFLGLTPMVYSTAKMAVLAYPLILFIISGAKINYYLNKKTIISLFILFLPLSFLFLSGGAASRFSYISVFTDPTVPTEVNHLRQLDSGPQAQVGSAPSLIAKLVHNKPLLYLGRLTNNFYNLLSTDYLFINGDPNQRHSPKGWGMLFKSALPALLIGIYFLVKFRHDRLLILIILLMGIAMTTSAITRDGGEHHASRSFMMTLPIVLVSGIGLGYLKSTSRILFSILSIAIIFESLFFLHDYWFHYRYSSERDWSAGMKEVILLANQHQDSPVVITTKYEYPLIFYLYYTNFDPKKFQEFVKSDHVYNPLPNNLNLEANQIGDSNLYIGLLNSSNFDAKRALPGAYYYLTRAEYENRNTGVFPSSSAVINLPSGEPLFYEIHQ